MAVVVATVVFEFFKDEAAANPEPAGVTVTDTVTEEDAEEEEENEQDEEDDEEEDDGKDFVLDRKTDIRSVNFFT